MPNDEQTEPKLSEAYNIPVQNQFEKLEEPVTTQWSSEPHEQEKTSTISPSHEQVDQVDSPNTQPTAEDPQTGKEKEPRYKHPHKMKTEQEMLKPSYSVTVMAET